MSCSCWSGSNGCQCISAIRNQKNEIDTMKMKIVEQGRNIKDLLKRLEDLEKRRNHTHPKSYSY